MFKGEYGKTIYVNCGIDISTATALSIQFTKPDGTITTETAILGTVDVLDGCSNTIGANTYLYYTTVDGDIDQDGIWSVRPIVDMDGKHLIGEKDTFKVKE